MRIMLLLGYRFWHYSEVRYCQSLHGAFHGPSAQVWVGVELKLVWVVWTSRALPLRGTFGFHQGMPCPLHPHLHRRLLKFRYKRERRKCGRKIMSIRRWAVKVRSWVYLATLIFHHLNAFQELLGGLHLFGGHF